MTDSQAHLKSFNFLVRYAPLWAHLIVYALTCLVAAVIFSIGYRPVLALVEYFSGAIVPVEYSSEQKVVLWALLVGAPVLFAFGFLVAMRVPLPRMSAFLQPVAGKIVREVPAWFPILLFGIVASMGMYDLIRAGAFNKLDIWGNYGAWVEGRWALFSTLGYFNFVNLYLLLPVSAAWVILTARNVKGMALFLRLTSFSIVFLLTFFLFQKKALVVSVIIIFSAELLYRFFSGNSIHRLKLILGSMVGLVLVFYFFLTVIPIYSQSSQTANEVFVSQETKIRNNHKPCEKEGVSDELRGLCKEVILNIGINRNVHMASYALLAPMTRTSLPAMYYPIVFPDVHDYYGLDLGQDILGFGAMPDDNLVIWRYMYPNLPGGSAGAPYQFALYSQVGVGWTLLLCATIGALLGWGWQVILECDISRVWRSLMGAVLMLFSIHLAIDSVRGSLLASYGLIWAWLFIGIFFFIGRIFQRRFELKKI